MFPNIWIIDTYDLMIVIGIIAGFYVLFKAGRSKNLKKVFLYDMLILGSFAIIFGFLGAVFTQWILNLLAKNSEASGKTFYGGLISGAIFFIIIFFLYYKRKYKEYKFKDILDLAPLTITIAHAFGRIGCFMAGCCYGIETDSIFGVKFPFLDYNVYPTQLFEAIFLFILFSVLYVLYIRKDNVNTMSIYLICYGLFRYFNEFLRGDYRGGFLSISPGQFFSIIIIVIGFTLVPIINAYNDKNIKKE